jgi:hypothetical protein
MLKSKVISDILKINHREIIMNTFLLHFLLSRWGVCIFYLLFSCFFNNKFIFFQLILIEQRGVDFFYLIKSFLRKKRVNFNVWKPQPFFQTYSKSRGNRPILIPLPTRPLLTLKIMNWQLMSNKVCEFFCVLSPKISFSSYTVLLLRTIFFQDLWSFVIFGTFTAFFYNSGIIRYYPSGMPVQLYT